MDSEATELFRALCAEEGRVGVPPVFEQLVDARRRFPEDPRFFALEASWLLTLGKLTVAEKLVEDFRAKHPDDAYALVSAASVVAFKGDEDTSRGLADRALELAGDTHYILLRCAALGAERLDNERARALLEKCLELEPNDVTTHHLYCNVLKGSDAQAYEAALLRAELLFPGYALIHIQKARKALRDSDLQTVINEAQYAVAAAPDLYTGWNLLAGAQFRLGRYDEAEVSAQYALQLNSRDSLAIGILMRVAKRRGKLARAEAYRRAFSQASPRMAQMAGVFEANHLSLQGRSEEAIRRLEKLERTACRIVANHARRRLVSLYIARGRLDQLRSVVERIEQCDRDTAELYLGRAKLVEADSVEQAISHLDEGLLHYKNDGNLHALKLLLLHKTDRLRSEELSAELADGPCYHNVFAAVVARAMIGCGFYSDAEKVLDAAARQSSAGDPLKRLRVSVYRKTDRQAQADKLEAELVASQKRPSIVMATVVLVVFVWMKITGRIPRL